MTSFDFARMRAQGRAALDQAVYSPRKMILVHGGVTIGLGLLLSVLSYLLDMGIAQTGGLGGIGTRTILETAQSLLETANMLLLPFWSIGYIRAILSLTRGEPTPLNTLLFGYKCFGPVIRLLFVQGLLWVLLAIPGAYVGAGIFLLTPGAQSLFALVEEWMASGAADPNVLLESEAYLAACMEMGPYLMLGAGLIVAPVAYRLRFAEFALMDAPWDGALRALAKSWRMTRKNCFSLLKLDLRFWWYHLAGLLIALLGYGDMLLPMVGVELRISSDAAMFGFYVAAVLCEFALFVWKKNEVFAVYALAYDQLNTPQEEVTKPQPTQVPWSV